MDDIPIFLQMFVRLFAAFALGAWLQSLAPRKTEVPTPAPQSHSVKQVGPSACEKSAQASDETAPAAQK